MKNSLKLALLSCLTGCATAAKVEVSPTAHPLATIANIEHKLDKGLVFLNIVGVVGVALGIGAIVYGLLNGAKPIEKIGMIVAGVAGSLVAVTLTGLFVLPFAPWIMLGTGIIALAFAGYYGYTKWFVAKTPAPIVAPPAPK
jgi:hypothetical protein